MTFFSRKTRPATRRSSSRLAHWVQLEKLEDRCLLTAGALDPTFGTGGIATAAAQYGYDVALQTDGKIVSVGSGNRDFEVVRLNPNGSPDTSFGSGGTVRTDFKGYADTAYAVAIQPDGKIIAAGTAGVLIKGKVVNENALVRYNANGTLDQTFGTKGEVLTAGTGRIADIVLQTDGKILAVGSSGDNVGGNGIGIDLALVRYNANGTLDTTFGSGGKVATDFFGLTDDGRSLALQGDGKIVVSGWASQSVNGSVVKRTVMLRYNGDGSLDTSFGVGGKVFSDAFALMTSSAWPYPTVTLQSVNGQVKVLLAGGSNDPYNRNFMLERYNSDGSLDSTFGTAGQTQTDFGQTIDYIHRVAVQADGKIVAAGETTVSATNYLSIFGLARYNADGTLDTTFGTGGLVRTQVFANVGGVDEGVAIQSDGKIVAVGWSNNNIVVTRYLADPPLLAVTAPAHSRAEIITTSDTQPLLSEARALWQSTGVDTSGLGNVQVQIANLGGTTLGLASGNTIWLDDNAAGWGWFIDTTPADSGEFFRPGNQGEQNRMDLLTVVMHELGHLLQQDHDADGVMAATLVAGVRNTSLMNEESQVVDAVFSQFHESQANDFLSALPDEHWLSHRPRLQRRR